MPAPPAPARRPPSPSSPRLPTAVTVPRRASLRVHPRSHALRGDASARPYVRVLTGGEYAEVHPCRDRRRGQHHRTGAVLGWRPDGAIGDRAAEAGVAANAGPAAKTGAAATAGAGTRAGVGGGG